MATKKVTTKKAAKAEAATRAALTDATKLTVVKEKADAAAYREGSRAAELLAMLAKCKTVGDFKKARVKAGMTDLIGGWLPSFIKKGYVAAS